MPNNKPPYYPMYPGDMHSDEGYQMMTWEERGIYRHLLDVQWLEGSIPAETEKLARICKIPHDHFLDLWRSIEPKFPMKSYGRIMNKKMCQLKKAQELKRERKIAAGIAGSKVRWDKEKDSSAIALPLANDSSSYSSSYSSSISENKEEEKKKRSPPPSRHKSKHLESISKRVELWNTTMSQSLKVTTYLDTIRKRIDKEPDFLEKLDKAIPMVPSIDDSGWSNSVSLAWLLRPGKNGDIPVVDKVVDGAYKKRPKKKKERLG